MSKLNQIITLIIVFILSVSYTIFYIWFIVEELLSTTWSGLWFLFNSLMLTIGLLLGLFIWGILYTEYSQYKSFYSNNKRDDEFLFKYNILLLLAAVMKTDRNLMDCESERVEAAIRRYYKNSKEQSDANNQFKRILNSKHTYIIGEICDDINKQFNYTAKSELIMELLAVAYADGTFNHDEQVMIETIVDKLNITPQEYKSIYAIFIMKFQQGYYNEAYPEKKDNFNENHNENDNHNDNGKRDKQSSYRQYNGISVEDAYIILGIEKSDSDTEIKKTYRALAVKCHPDNASSLGDEAIRQATETMKQINMAWDVVKMARGIK